MENIDTEKNKIMDCAMELFTEKGYENTTIDDLAKELNMDVQLCSHYFESKQCLYDEALKNYIDICSNDIIEILKSKPELKDLMRNLNDKADDIRAKFKYSKFFDKNQQCHKQLEYGMAEKIAPYAVEYIKVLKKKSEINMENPMSIAKLILRCEMIIFNNEIFAGSGHVTQNKILKKLY